MEDNYKTAESLQICDVARRSGFTQWSSIIAPFRLLDCSHL